MDDGEIHIIPDWLKSVIIGVRADKRKPKMPYYLQCPERPFYTVKFPDCACATCRATVRSKCKYTLARRNKAVVYHGPDFRPHCVWGMSFRASRSTRPMLRCGVPDMDCLACNGHIARNERIVRQVLNSNHVSDTNVLAATIDGGPKA